MVTVGWWRCGGKALVGASIVVVCVAGCSSNVIHGVDERTANEAVSVLERAAVGAEKIADEPAAGGTTYAVRVARADATRALDLLRGAGLPRERRRGFTETYAQPSLIPTTSEEHARYLDALSGEIERTLESVESIVAARVHLVLEEIDPLLGDSNPRTPARAAVLLKVRQGRDPLSESDVQKLVAGSVGGLEPSAVAVVTTAASPDEAGEPFAPALTAVGPLRVSPGTRALLEGAIIAVLALLGILSALLFLTARRLSAFRERPREATGETRRDRGWKATQLGHLETDRGASVKAP